MKKNQDTTNAQPSNEQESNNHSSASKFVAEAAEHAVEHGIGHALAGSVGGFLAGLLHVGTLNENEEVDFRKDDYNHTVNSTAPSKK